MHTPEPRQEESDLPSTSLTQQFSDALLWLNERSWPLTGSLLFISLLYIIQFIAYEKIPLSITSASIITALPALLSLLVLLFFIACIFLLSPTITLLTRFNKNNNSLIADIWSKKTACKNKNQPTIKIIALWLLKTSFLGAILGSPVWIPYSLLDKNIPTAIALGIISWIFVSLLFLLLIIKTHTPSLKIKHIRHEFYIRATYTLFIQLITMAGAALILYGKVNTSPKYIQFISILASSIGLGIIQAIGTHFLWRTSESKNKIATAGITAYLLIVLLGIIPTSASYLTGKILQATASGMRQCAIFIWTENNPQGMEAINQSDTPRQSIPLYIMTEADGFYITRKQPENKNSVYFVPRTLVSRIETCISNYH